MFNALIMLVHTQSIAIQPLYIGVVFFIYHPDIKSHITIFQIYIILLVKIIILLYSELFRFTLYEVPCGGWITLL
jgi:hypothetical protein